jgi:hypothetical protein
MSYGDTKAKQTGIKREAIIIDELSEALIKAGYPNRIISAGVFENINKHIDAKIQLPSVLLKGYEEIPIDIKSTESLTIRNKKKQDTLRDSEAIYYVFEYSADSPEYVFVKRTRLIEVMDEHPPRLFIGYDGISHYFWLRSYLDIHGSKFNSDDLFKINK